MGWGVHVNDVVMYVTTCSESECPYRGEVRGTRSDAERDREQHWQEHAAHWSALNEAWEHDGTQLRVEDAETDDLLFFGLRGETGYVNDVVMTPDGENVTVYYTAGEPVGPVLAIELPRSTLVVRPQKARR